MGYEDSFFVRQGKLLGHISGQELSWGYGAAP